MVIIGVRWVVVIGVLVLCWVVIWEGRFMVRLVVMHNVIVVAIVRFVSPITVVLIMRVIMRST